MSHQDDLTASVLDVINRLGNARDASYIGDFAVFHRHIDIHADQHAFAV